ncbi:MAG: hypothetical protein ACXABV_03750 [Candidatus Thorarchaeota archaeon]|jgi:hypothetical protein
MTSSEEGGPSLGFKLTITILFSCILWAVSFALIVANPFAVLIPSVQFFLIACTCFSFGVGAQVFFRKTRVLKVGVAGGFAVSIGAWLVGGIFALATVITMYAMEALAVVIASGFIVVLIFRGRFLSAGKSVKGQITAPTEIHSSKSVSIRRIVKVLEVVQVPLSYIEQETSGQDRMEPYVLAQRALATLVHDMIPIGIRMQRIDNVFRMFFLTWSDNSENAEVQMTALRHALDLHMPRFKFRICKGLPHIKEDLTSRLKSSCMTGEPLIDDGAKSINGLTVAAQMLLRLDYDGVMQIFAIPKKPGYWAKRGARGEFRESARDAPHSQAITDREGNTQTYSAVDPEALVKRGRAERRLKRLQGKTVFEVQITSACRAKDEKAALTASKQVLHAMAGTVRSSDPVKGFEIKEGGDAPRLFHHGWPSGPKTQLTLDETTLYFVFPLQDLGLSVSDHASFQTNPEGVIREVIEPISSSMVASTQHQKSSVVLGSIFDERGKPAGLLRIPLDDLASHVGIYGDIGKGKTWTALTILMALHGAGVNFIVLLASKNEEYLPLIREIPNLRVFTPGDETTAPVRISMTPPTEGVHVSNVINSVKDAFVAAMPSIGMVKEYLEAAVEATFDTLGWNREKNERGLPVLLSDFLHSIPLVEEADLDYSVRGNQDFRGTLHGRFRALNRGGLSYVLNTLTGISMEELTSQPTLFLMDKLSTDEQALLTYHVILNLSLYFESLKKVTSGKKKGLKYFVLLEEAHRFLSGKSGGRIDEAHAAQQKAQATIAQTMQEGRSAGLGFGIVDQKPHELSMSAVNLPLTNIMHGKGASRDRSLIGDQMNCTEEQKRFIGSLPVGQVAVKTARSSGPVRVQVLPVSEKYPRLLEDKPVSDKDLASKMKSVYDENSNFRDIVDNQTISSDILSHDYHLEINVVTQLIHLANHKMFEKGFLAAIEATSKGDFRIGALAIIEVTKRVAKEQRLLGAYCEFLIWEASRKLIDKKTEPSTQKILKELRIHLGIDSTEDWLDSSRTAYYTRLSIEAVFRLQTQSSSLIKVNRRELIREALRAAVRERNRLQKMEAAGAAEEENPEADELNHETEEFILSIINTHEFAKRYFERITRAANGDLEPIKRFILAIVGKFDSSQIDLQALTGLLMEKAREILDAPHDDVLWDHIVTSVQEGLIV